MKILIIGNVGSGKTTLGKKIQEITGYKFVQIDELREKYLKNSVSEEYYCLYKFLKSIEENENLILEFTGVGCHKYAIRRALEFNDDKIMVILCMTRNFELIKKRVESKTFPYSSPFDVNIKEHIQFINDELSKDLNNNFWESNRFQFLKFYMETINDLNTNIEEFRKNINLELSE